MLAQFKEIFKDYSEKEIEAANEFLKTNLDAFQTNLQEELENGAVKVVDSHPSGFCCMNIKGKN